MTELKRYCFRAEYYDAPANLTRDYQLLYHLEDDTIEMYDLKTKRLFLKRCAYPSLSLTELFVGATVTIFSRPLKVVDYGDEVTRKHFTATSSELMIAISEDGLLRAGDILTALTEKKVRLTALRLVDIPREIATRNGTTSRCVIAVVNGANAAETIGTIAASYHGAVSVINEMDARDVQNIALGASKTTASMQSCAVCVVKPHAITSGYHGPILQRLLDEGFYVSALGLYTMSAADADDFLEVYNGVVPEYKKLVEQMSSGACLAIEVCAENAVPALRAVCGPHDPEICHVLFPHTIRAKFGIDRCRSAVHCTDLEEDGPLESEFFFSLLQNKA